MSDDKMEVVYQLCYELIQHKIYIDESTAKELLPFMKTRSNRMFAAVFGAFMRQMDLSHEVAFKQATEHLDLTDPFDRERMGYAKDLFRNLELYLD